MNRDRGLTLFDKAIDNSQVVREQNPQSRRDLRTVLLLVALLVSGLVLYAWPHFAARQTGMASEQLQREKERLREENRKLRLERAVLENLGRVETIAAKRLGLGKPKLEQIVVVETVTSRPPDQRAARKQARRADDKENGGSHQ